MLYQNWPNCLKFNSQVFDLFLNFETYATFSRFMDFFDHFFVN